MPKLTLAIAAGYTRPIFATADVYDLELLVQPDTDFDTRFRAYDTDNDEWLWVNGWMFVVEDAEYAPDALVAAHCVVGMVDAELRAQA